MIVKVSPCLAGFLGVTCSIHVSALTWPAKRTEHVTAKRKVARFMLSPWDMSGLPSPYEDADVKIVWLSAGRLNAALTTPARNPTMAEHPAPVTAPQGSVR